MEGQLKNRIWIEKEGEPFLGKGRIELLKLLDETGSISASAKAMKMSYKKAWTLIDSMNELGREAVTVQQTGGKNGGGTTLTPYGRKLITTFDELTLSCDRFLNEEFKKLKL